MVKVEIRQGNTHWQDHFYGRYFNVPITKYNRRSKALIAVGRVIDVRQRWVKSSMLCTRSQFTTHQNLFLTKSTFNFLKHDYGLLSKVLIFLSIKYWARRDNY